MLIQELYTNAVVPSFIRINVNIDESIDEILRLLKTCPHSQAISQYLQYITNRNVMRNVYLTRIVPFCDRQSDNLNRRIATELQPDPFGIASSTRQKWLCSDTMNIYGMFLRDLARNLNGPSVYYLSAGARFLYLLISISNLLMQVGTFQSSWTLIMSMKAP